MPKIAITLNITSYSFLVDVIRLLKTPEEIISLFDEVPFLHEDGFVLSFSEKLSLTIALALYPARVDLIEKHKIKFSGARRIFDFMSSTSNIEDVKKLFDVIIAYNSRNYQSDTYLLRWIATDCHRSSVGPLIDYCIEKGYLAGINEGLVNAVESGLGKEIYGKLLDSGADPTVSHRDYTNRSAIDQAFRSRTAEAIRLFIERGYDLSAQIAKISRANYHLYGIPLEPVKKMINGILYTLSGDNKTATAEQLTTTEGLVTTQLTVVRLEDQNYMFINPINHMVFGERIPVSAFAE